jgi:hypothetical protein
MRETTSLPLLDVSLVLSLSLELGSSEETAAAMARGRGCASLDAAGCVDEHDAADEAWRAAEGS